VRRVIITPIAWEIILALVVVMPVALLIALIASAFGSGRLRAPRVLWMATVYLALEAIALVVLFGLWIGSGFGWRLNGPRFQRVHYVLTGLYLRILYRTARWALRVRVEVIGTDPDIAAPGKPELVFCRHAGPGDSFLLIHALVNWFDREPRIVLKDTLQWDPAIDVLLNRLPNRFIRPDPGKDGARVVAQVGELSRNLDANDAFVIFPEGGNVTEHRRKRAIERLRRKGHIDEAEKAEQLKHVMAPKPGGVTAALTQARDADVVFVAHTGVEHMVTVLDVWRELPMDREIQMRWWIVPAAEVPTGEAERIDWLFAWWATIDRWIDERQAEAGLATPR
jgi:1-acyl-sn-glycerol-3-phosphate acyltransferase